MNPLISLNDITLRAGEQLSFPHTTWQIEAGQHWAILGPTGAGKSTLAKGLCRQLPLVQGQILYFFGEASQAGRPYLHSDEVLTFSAETHQAFFRQFVEYHQARWQSFEGEEAPRVGALLDGAADAEKTAGVIELLGIQPLLERKVHQLSHGESRKLFLARLLLQAPRLLILDDPFTGLDAASRERLKTGIARLLADQAPSVLFLSARYADIPAGIDHLLLVRDHRVLAQGDRDALQSNPDYRDFFSTPGTNRGSSRSASALPPAFSKMVERYADTLAAGGGLPAETGISAGKSMPAEKSISADESRPELIAMHAVSITYQGLPVLNGVDWTVRQGERWALLGPNGAGKTTLLSLILADNPQAYTNDIRLFGRQRGSGESIWQIKRRIGWVSPELHVFYERSATARDVIASGFFDSVGLYRQCSAEQAAIASDWMAALDLTPLAERPLHTLSAGQQRLVLLARALVKAPPLLVLDEPCQGLDSAHRDQMIDLIDRLCGATPVTLIYVSHYQEELPIAITHRLYLNEGQALYRGPVDQ